MDYLAFMGPTGIGKTDALLRLRQTLGDVFEVVNVDSVQVYQGLDIGSAKPSKEEQALLPHHLLDVVPPCAHYDVARFCKDAEQAILAIKKRGKVPVLAGGTMLYFHSFLHGIADIPSISCEAKAITQAYMQQGVQLAWEYANAWDLEACKKISRNDKQRIQRVLEVFVQTGKPLSQWQAETMPLKSTLKGMYLVCMPEDRASLRSRLAKRFSSMLQHGLVQEVKDVLATSKAPLTLEHASMRSIGYRQVFEHLAGTIPMEQLAEQASVATRRYMKRQLTWLRNWQAEHDKVQSIEQAENWLATRIVRMHQA